MDNKVYFCISDIHSFFTSMKSALKSSGFKKSNPNHILVICGDIFDRGNESIEVYKYIKSIPKSRRILIQGNHELLYLDLLNKNYPDRHDFSNGTVKTFCHIAGIDETLMSSEYYYTQKLLLGDKYNLNINKTLNDIWKDVRDKVSKSSITRFIKSKEWKNYYELDDYIFVHSFIPLKVKKIPETKWIRNYPTYQVHPKYLEPVLNWRSESYDIEWDDAKWGCPWLQFKYGLFDTEIKNNKILVCGHWHVSDFHKNLNKNHPEEDNYNLYFGKNIIGLDACTALTHKCNVLVIDKNLNKCFDQFKNELIAEEDLKYE